METKYEKAVELLKTSHSCPALIAIECGIDGEILHDMSDGGCYYDEWAGSCKTCREDALEFMMKHIKE